MGEPELKLGREILISLGIMALYPVLMILSGPAERLFHKANSLVARFWCRFFGHRMKPVYQTFYGLWRLDHVVGHKCERCKVERDV